MNIRVVFPIEAADGVDDGLWLLACGGAIQVNQRLAMHQLQLVLHLFLSVFYVLKSPVIKDIAVDDVDEADALLQALIGAGYNEAHLVLD